MSMQFESQPSGANEYGYEQVQEASTASRSANQLLISVLGETLSRRREDPAALIQVLREWRSMLADHDFGPDVCEQVVLQVLIHRLGAAASDLPDRLYQEIGAVLWRDRDSRQRIRRLWNELGAMP